MSAVRPYVLSIAGFDPSSGAGLTADIKTFEQCGVYGLALCTALTLQTEDEFFKLNWRNETDLKEELMVLLNKYAIKAVKFGITPSHSFLKQLTSAIKNHNSKIQIVVDPIWKASSGPLINADNFSSNKELLKDITLLTPNLPELEYLCEETDTKQCLKSLSQHTAILLKGGHNPEKTGIDELWQNGSCKNIDPMPGNYSTKHGSGCVLSAAITANMAKGLNLLDACKAAKRYTENFLQSNQGLLGYHAA